MRISWKRQNKSYKKKQCRNPSKKNWIFQAEPEISKWLLKEGIINLDLVKLYTCHEIFQLDQFFNFGTNPANFGT